MSNKDAGKRLVIVSNRLPVVLIPDEHGAWSIKSGSGGRVTALAFDHFEEAPQMVTQKIVAARQAAKEG